MKLKEPEAQCRPGHYETPVVPRPEPVCKKLRSHNGPLPKIDVVCEGGPWERGFAQGLGLSGVVRSSIDILEQLESFTLRKPRWVPYRLFRSQAARLAEAYLAGPVQETFPECWAYLQGLARGSGLDLRLLLLLHSLEAAICSLDDSTEVPSLMACSTVAVRGRASATGEPIIAKNFDYLPLVRPYYAIRDSRPDKGCRALEFTVAFLSGTLDAVNERGLAVSYNYAFSTDVGSPAPTISLALAEALRRFGTVVDAVSWIQEQPRCGGGLIMLADASGDLASLELSPTRTEVRRPSPGEDTLVHTNLYSTDRMREVQLSRDAVYSGKAPKVLRGQRVLEPFSCHHERLDGLLSGRGALNTDDLARVMADHGEAGVPSADTVCVHSPYWATTACCQLLPRSRRLRIAYDYACRAQYEEFNL